MSDNLLSSLWAVISHAQAMVLLVTTILMEVTVVG